MWRKTDFADPAAAPAEAAGLRWLAEVADGARVVGVRGAEPGVLDLDRVERGRPASGTAHAFGHALARTHAAGADCHGFVPGEGYVYMGRLRVGPAPQPPVSWGEFYARQRIEPYLRRAVEQGRLGGAGQRTIEAVLARLIDGELDHPQPALLPPGGAARLHGDLWNGNVLWDARGEAVLIDPTAHGGHAETDLAMLALFGAPLLGEILTGYEEASALAPGWRDRVDLHQLNPLLVHTVLFGGSYADAAIAAAAPYA